MGGDRERAAGKVTGIWHVVRLREMLQKWQSTALGPRKDHEQEEEEDDGVVAKATGHAVSPPPSGISPAVDKRLKRAAKGAFADVSDDDENCNSPEPPPDVPKGYLAVYVGQEQRRFVMPTSYLGEPVFGELLRKAEEEFGFEHEGAITFPCEIETFKYILQCTHRQHHRNTPSSWDKTEEEEELLPVDGGVGKKLLPDVPKGYLAVYVGQEQRRFVMPTSYLGEPVFGELLRKAEEEFGFEHEGAITFPCEIETFKYILQCTHRQHHRNTPSSWDKTMEEEELLPVDGEGKPSKVEE